MAIDRKYGRVDLDKGDIGVNEPVFVFRAQDSMLPQVLKYYRDLCARAGSPRVHLENIEASSAEITHWQANNKIQVPQSKDGNVD